jgi:glycine/D-amino acid oxidase-like deaminating enzyme
MGKLVNESLFAENFKTDPYWWDATPRPDLGVPDLPKTADVVVIGSGYTGLNAALETARAGRHTLVLDAEAAGFGCSTRNGGQISTSVKSDLVTLSAKYGSDTAFAIMKEGHNALAWIEDFVKREQIDCDFKVPGRFHAAHSAAQYEKLASEVGPDTPGLEVEARLVPRSEQQSELGTDAYYGGVVFPKHASLDPGRYHKGLMERVQAAGASVIGHCAVTAVERQNGGFLVTTRRGKVSARDVVVATNGYTGSVTPWQRRRVIPIGSYVIATEPLAPEVMDRLMPTDRVVSDTRKVVYYYRPSPDRTRILFGGRVSHDETDPRTSGPRLHQSMTGIFPELAGTAISHSWAGFVAYTFDELAHCGKHDGLYYAMGYCGSGVSMASYLGMRTGQSLLGLKEGKTGFDGLTFQTRPFYTGNPWFLGATVMYYRWRDRQS